MLDSRKNLGIYGHLADLSLTPLPCVVSANELLLIALRTWYTVLVSMRDLYNVSVKLVTVVSNTQDVIRPIDVRENRCNVVRRFLSVNSVL